MSADPPLLALTLAAALHAGFQVTVTLLVYPALLRDGHDWVARHAAHGRRIVPLVVLTYGALLLSVVWVVASGAGSAGAGSAGAWVASGAFAVILTLTALGAAPRHARLAREFDPQVATALLRVDRWRCGLAVVALGGAFWAILTG